MKNKPLTLIVRETEEKLIKEINESNLPPFIMKEILERIYKQLVDIETNEIEEYNKSLNEKKKEEKNEKTNA